VGILSVTLRDEHAGHPREHSAVAHAAQSSRERNREASVAILATGGRFLETTLRQNKCSSLMGRLSIEKSTRI